MPQGAAFLPGAGPTSVAIVEQRADRMNAQADSPPARLDAASTSATKTRINEAMTVAFSAPVPVSLAGRADPNVRHRPRLRVARRPAPSLAIRAALIEPSLIVDTLLLGGTIAIATTYLRGPRRSAPKRPEPKDEPEAPEPQPSSGGGVLGFSLLDRPKDQEPRWPSQTPTSTTPAPPFPVTPPDTDSTTVPPGVAALVDDYLEMDDASSVSNRLTEELQWAAGQMAAAGANATLIFGPDKKLLYQEGALVGPKPNTALPFVKQVRKSGEAVVFDIDRVLPEIAFVSAEAKNVAVLPIGETGAVLIIASERPSFYSIKEKRLSDAVCNRLSTFLFTEQFKGSTA